MANPPASRGAKFCRLLAVNDSSARALNSTRSRSECQRHVCAISISILLTFQPQSQRVRIAQSTHDWRAATQKQRYHFRLPMRIGLCEDLLQICARSSDADAHLRCSLSKIDTAREQCRKRRLAPCEMKRREEEHPIDLHRPVKLHHKQHRTRGRAYSVQYVGRSDW